VTSDEGANVFGANAIGGNSHLIPNTSVLFGPNDYGTPLSELEDSLYHIAVASFSVAPPDSPGFGLEANVSCSSADFWFFEISGGVVVDLYQAN
jgi:hypothetical protein